MKRKTLKTRFPRAASIQQRSHRRRIEAVRNIRVGEDSGGELALVLLQLVDALLDGVLAEQFVDEDRVVLAMR